MPTEWMTRRFIIFALSLIMLPLLMFAYPNGAPDGFSGAPGEGTCQTCHANGPDDGALEILGVPSSYTPYQFCTLTVRLQDSGQDRWGFQLTAVDADGNGVGTFTVTDAVNTLLSDNTSPGRDYMKQTTSGTFSGTAGGPVEWSFLWQAPATGAGQVTFYAAGNASVAGGGVSGNNYVTSAESEYESCCAPPFRGNVDNIVGPAGPVDVSDLTYLVAYLFSGGAEPPCIDEGNIDGIIGPAGPIDVSDLTYLVAYLFSGGPDPAACP